MYRRRLMNPFYAFKVMSSCVNDFDEQIYDIF